MGLLTREQLLKKDELKREQVILDKETNEFVYVRQMTAREKNTWEMSQVKKTGVGGKTTYDVSLEDYRAKLAVVTVCNAKGELIFEPGDYKDLSMNMSAAKLEKIVDVAQALNTITKEDQEEMVKN